MIKYIAILVDQKLLTVQINKVKTVSYMKCMRANPRFFFHIHSFLALETTAVFRELQQ